MYYRLVEHLELHSFSIKIQLVQPILISINHCQYTHLNFNCFLPLQGYQSWSHFGIA